MNTDFWFWGFCMVCKVSVPTTFREPLWFPSSMVIEREWAATPTPPLYKAASQSAADLRSMTTEDGNHSDSRNVVGKRTLHTVQNPKTKYQS